MGSSAGLRSEGNVAHCVYDDNESGLKDWIRHVQMEERKMFGVW